MQKEKGKDVQLFICKAKSMRLLLIIVFLLSLLFLYSCGSKPDYETEQAWQKNFREALIDGYTDFKGHFVDTDVPVYIFSYKLPAKYTAKDVFSALRKQIINYKVTFESNNELALRRLGTFQKHEAFDEYRFLINDKKITVMFSSIDSKTELDTYPFFIKKFKKVHLSLKS